jgi:hypothetical protein
MPEDVSNALDTDQPAEPLPCPGCSDGWMDLGKGTVAPCPHHRPVLYERWLKRELRGMAS